MTETDTPQLESVPKQLKSLADHIGDALGGAAPLDFAGVKKTLKTAGIQLTGKGKVSDDDIRSAIAEFVQSGRAFKHLSGGAKGSERYWCHDEKDRTRKAVLTAAATATPFDKLKKVAKGLFKGTQDEYADGIVRELIGEEKLHEHPPKKAGGPVQYATFVPPPPPPPLPWYETKKLKKDADKLFDIAKKLLDKSGEPLESLMTILRAKLEPLPDTAEDFDLSDKHAEESVPNEELGQLILTKISEQKPVASMTIAELRETLPKHYRGRVFDVTVFHLVEQSRVRLYPAAIPAKYTSDQSGLFVRDAHGHIYTSIGIEGE